jgi:hypothetical protein
MGFAHARREWLLGGLGAVIVLAKGTAHLRMEAPWTDPSLRELFALSMLASLGCGLALAVDELLFAAIFAAAIAVTIIGG